MAEWSYSEGAHRYRDSASGRFLAPTTVLTTRDDFLTRRAEAVQQITASMTDGSVTVQAWERSMQTEIQRLYGAQFAYGRGGRNAMTEADWQAAADMARGQFGYLRSFAEAAVSGDLSAARMQARAAMYASSAVQAFEAGRVAAFGMPPLSRHPGDGSEACKSNCRCHLDIEVTEAGWDVFWRLGATEQHCADCSGLAATWSPLAVQRPQRAAA